MKHRNKPAPRKVAAIEIGRRQLNLAVYSPSEAPLRWRTTARLWNEDGVSPLTAQGRTALREAMAALAAQEKLRGCLLHVALAREFCATRVVAGGPDHVRRELERLSQRASLYLGLGSGPKACSAAIATIDGRNEHGCLAVANERFVETVVEASLAAGLQLGSVFPSHLAICRLLAHLKRDAVAPVAIARRGDTGLELAVSSRGRLLLDYRAGDSGSASEVAGSIARHWSRLNRYCERYAFQVKAPPAANRPCAVAIFAPTNEALAMRAELARAGIEADRLDLSTLATTTDDADGSSRLDCAAAIGACLAAAETSKHPLPNLAEAILRARREPLAPALVKKLWPLAAALVVSCGMWGVAALEGSRRDRIAGEFELLEPKLVCAERCRVDIARTTARIVQLDALRDAIADPAWRDLISTVGHCLPDDAWLTRLHVDEHRRISISGACLDGEGAYEFVRWLDAAPGFVDVQLESMHPLRVANLSATGFEIKLKIESPRRMAKEVEAKAGVDRAVEAKFADYGRD